MYIVPFKRKRAMKRILAGSDAGWRL